MSSEQEEIMNELLEAGVHYGHQTKRWNPKMKPYILEDRNGIYVIDIEQTLGHLAKAAEFLTGVIRNGGKVLFVGTKKQAQDAIKESAVATSQFFVNQRWLGGTLTNLTTIRKSVRRLRDFEENEKTPEFTKLNKAEASALRREATKLRKNLEGVLDMDSLPDAMIVIDTNRESIAVAEADRLGIPVVAILDTNCDPDKVTHPIAGNDDAVRSIRVILQKLVNAIAIAQGVAKDAPSELSGISE